MHSCHHLLLIICEILRVIASLLKSRVVLVLCCFLELRDVFLLFPDLLAVPDLLIGAMEEWGLVMFRSSYLVYDELFCSTGVKLAVTKVIAHELAHQVI